MVEEVRAGALGRAVGMGVVTRRVLAAPVVCAAAAEGRGAVREVAGAAVSLGVASCVVEPVGVLAGGEGPAVVWVVGSEAPPWTRWGYWWPREWRWWTREHRVCCWAWRRM